MTTPEEPLVTDGEVVGGRWKCEGSDDYLTFNNSYTIKKLGEGGFGAVFEVEDTTNKERHALKAESVKEACQVLKMEAAVLGALHLENKLEHACRLYGSGRTNKINYIVMSLVGKNFGDLKRDTKAQKFSVSTCTRLSSQCVKSLEHIHYVGFLHRDLKPGNYAIGRGDLARIAFVLDFGLARKYVTPTGKVKPARSTAGFRGTVRYASVQAHNNYDMGRIDDLWCLFYMMIELQAGEIPWRRIDDKNKVCKIKETITGEALCKNCPDEYLQINNYLKTVKFADKPDYNFLYGILNNINKRHHVKADEPYDWEKGASTIERLEADPLPASLLGKLRLNDPPKAKEAAKKATTDEDE